MSFEIRVECMECGMIQWVDAEDKLDAFRAADIVEDHEHLVVIKTDALPKSAEAHFDGNGPI